MSARRSATPRRSVGAPRAAALDDQLDFLRRSLEDLDREHEAGEVDERDFASLRDRYTARLAEVEASLAAGPATAAGPAAAAGPATAATARRKRRLSRRVRVALGVGAAACFVAAAALLAASLAGVRLPGESASGSVSLSGPQQEQETLDRAAILGSEGKVAEAVALYGQVLRTDPNQPNALAYGGWLVRLTGLAGRKADLVSRGDASIERAVAVAPGYPDAHALDGVVQLLDHRRAAVAAAQFRDALSAHASANLVASVAAIAKRAFAAAHEPLPEPYAKALAGG